MSSALKVAYQSDIEVSMERGAGSAAVKIITESFQEKDFKPLKLQPYELMLGYDIKGNAIVVDMNRRPHLLIAGATGMGKSRCLLIILTNLIYSYKKNLEIYLLSLSKNDLKKFLGYEPVKKFSKDLNEIRGIYEDLEKQMEKREALIDKEGFDNIEEYNQGKNRMKYIYLFADEFSSYMPDDSDTKQEKEAKEVCLALLKKIIKQGRSSGLFVVMGIQVSTYEEMPTIIRRCCNVKLTFKQSDVLSSRAIINTSDATGLEPREFFVLTDSLKRAKTPRIDKSIIQQYIGSPEPKEAKEANTRENKGRETAVFIPSPEPIKKAKATDTTNYGKLPRGKKKGVVAIVNAEG